MIHPTIGRVVWFMPRTGDERLQKYDPPFAAIVCYVWTVSEVNLLVIGPEGTVESQLNVALVQEDNEAPTDVAYCTWMPYQKGQAARLEAEIAKNALAQ